MKKQAWKTYALWILATEAVGALAAFLTGDGIRLYREEVIQPRLAPPAIVFPIVWTLLYALMGIGAARIVRRPPSGTRTAAMALYLVQLAFNFVWSLLFFNARAFGLSFVWLAALLILIVWMIAYFEKLDRPAAWIQLPYALWVAFAGYLNYAIWLLNR